IAGHSAWLDLVHVLPDGRTVLSAAYDRTVRYWDIAIGREQRRVALDVPAGSFATAFTADGRGLLGRNTWAGSIDHENYFWDVETGKRQPLAEAFTSRKAWILTGPVSGSILVADNGSQTVTLRDWPSGRLRHA